MAYRSGFDKGYATAVACRKEILATGKDDIPNLAGTKMRLSTPEATFQGNSQWEVGFFDGFFDASSQWIGTEKKEE